MDDLDSTLFGRPKGPKTKPTLGNLDSLFGETKKPTPKKTSFLEGTSSGTASHAPGKSALDSLFTETPADSAPITTSTAPAQSITRPARQQIASGTLGGLLGPSRREKEAPPQTPAQPPAAPSSQAAARAPEDVLREKRLENEVERLNREIDDLKRRKKDDETDLESLWKEKLAKKDRDHVEELKNLEDNYQKQIAKLNEEHEKELENLKITYARQLEVIQQSTGEWKDVTTVVNKVDTLSTTLNQLADSVTLVSDRALLEKETTLRIREEQLKDREQRLSEERTQFEDERKKVYELNAKLNDLCKAQETIIGQDKYRVREEWNRLNAEKQAFKEDQKFVLQTIEKQAAAVENSKSAFFHEQHDLLTRLSAERQLLEQEKNEFHGKRSVDVRRLKEEAAELQQRADNILAAETQIEKLRKHYELKTRQLQELEISLMEECLKMENLRNQLSQTESHILQNVNRETSQSKPAVGPDPDLITAYNDQEFSRRQESVGNVLKKHSEFLERYMGQKVAAVAPRPVNFNSP